MLFRLGGYRPSAAAAARVAAALAGPRLAISHFLFYAALIVQPVVGYLGSSFTRYRFKILRRHAAALGWTAPA